MLKQPISSSLIRSSSSSSSSSSSRLFQIKLASKQIKFEANLQTGLNLIEKQSQCLPSKETLISLDDKVSLDVENRQVMSFGRHPKLSHFSYVHQMFVYECYTKRFKMFGVVHGGPHRQGQRHDDLQHLHPLTLTPMKNKLSLRLNFTTSCYRQLPENKPSCLWSWSSFHMKKRKVSAGNKWLNLFKSWCIPGTADAYEGREIIFTRFSAGCWRDCPTIFVVI